MSDLFDKIYGCLIGVAAGDAMGMPSSMMDPEIIRQTFNSGIKNFLAAPAGHIIHNGLKAGEITDDTQQTLLVADSLIEQGCVDPQDIANRLIKWAESLGAFDSAMLGPSTLRSLYAIRSGRSIEESGSVGDTNGAAMKISPVGIYGMGNMKRTLQAVSQACLPTHNTNIAIAGAAAIAIAVGTAIHTKSSVDQIIQLALQAAELGMKKGNIWFGASIPERTKLALSIVARSSGLEEAMRELYQVIGAGVMMTETVPTCLAIVKMADGNPVEAIRIAANLGGDCDTIASIVGAICGAISGAKHLPAQWIKTIEDVNHLQLDQYAFKLEALVNKTIYSLSQQEKL
jgi:ADP-ribosylglycohydrolase